MLTLGNYDGWVVVSLGKWWVEFVARMDMWVDGSIVGKCVVFVVS